MEENEKTLIISFFAGKYSHVYHTLSSITYTQFQDQPSADKTKIHKMIKVIMIIIFNKIFSYYHHNNNTVNMTHINDNININCNRNNEIILCTYISPFDVGLKNIILAFLNSQNS